jgi:hypothetical protein
MRVLIDDKEIDRSNYRKAASRKKGDFVIVRRWFDPAKHLFLAFFCVLWDGFLVFWYSNLMSGSAHTTTGGTPGPFFYLFPLIHVTVGIGLTYGVIAGFFNTTRIGLRGDDFFVEHGPIPWRGNRVLRARSITQFFTEEKVSTDKDGATTRTYHLAALVGDDERLRLLSNLPTVDQALFLEQAFEERLDIVDVEVAGELGT